MHTRTANAQAHANAHSHAHMNARAHGQTNSAREADSAYEHVWALEVAVDDGRLERVQKCQARGGVSRHLQAQLPVDGERLHVGLVVQQRIQTAQTHVLHNEAKHRSLHVDSQQTHFIKTMQSEGLSKLKTSTKFITNTDVAVLELAEQKGLALEAEKRAHDIAGRSHIPLDRDRAAVTQARAEHMREAPRRHKLQKHVA